MKTIKTYSLIIFLLLIALSGSSQQISFATDVSHGCYPLHVNFTNTSNTPPGTIFVWGFGNGQNFIGQNASYTFVLSGTYEVILKAYSPQSQYMGEARTSIKVSGVNNFVFYTNDTVCPNEVFYVGIDQQYDSIKWVFSDGTILKNNWASHSFSDPGTYGIKLYVHTACGFDSVTQNVTVTSSAVPTYPSFNIPGSQFCVGDQIPFYSNLPFYSYHWDFDDGNFSDNQNPNYSYSSNGFRNITLTVTNVCGNSNSASNSIDISGNVPANANFSSQDNAYCPNHPINFDASAGAEFLWDYGDGNTSFSQNTKYLFADTGTYTVTLIVTNGCGNSDTVSHLVDIQYDPSYKPYVEAYFNNSNYNKDTLRICTGEEVAFQSWASGSGSIAIKWDFGDGTFSNDKDPIHVFSTSGLHQVTLVAVNNCNGTDTVKKWVLANPNANPISHISALPNIICPGEKVYFFDDGNRMIGSGYNYSIWFGDGDSLINLSAYSDTNLQVVFHQYTNPGLYHYTFTVTNTCGNSNSITDAILVNDNIANPSFYFVQNSTEDGNNSSQDNSGCVGDSVKFIIVGGSTYEWHFGDGTTSTEQIAYHSYADTGSYNAFAIATNSCGRVDTIQTVVSISNTNIPKPWFNVDEDHVCAETELDFVYSDNSNRAQTYTYQWDFRDGTTSSMQNPEHFYATGGDYNVKLVVTSGCGSDSSFRLIKVVNPITAFSVSQNIVQENGSVNFTNHSQNASVYLWDFGDNTTATTTNPSHTYTTQGTYIVTLTASNSFGCTSFITDTIFVHNMLITHIVHENSCAESNDGYIDVTVTGGLPPYSYQWFLNNLPIQVTTQDFLFHNPQFANSFGAGNYRVRITDSNGMVVMQDIVVGNPANLSIVSIVKNEICITDGSISSHPTGGTAPYLFNWSNLKTDTIITNLWPGDYSLTVTDAHGCIASQAFQIQGRSRNFPIVFTQNNSPTCTSSNGFAWAQLINAQDIGEYTFEWNDPSHQHNDTAYNLAAGVYQLTVTDTVTGCTKINTIFISDQGSAYIEWIDVHPIVCFDAANGSAEVHVSAISPPLTFVWSTNPPQTGALAQNLSAGNYAVSATDQNGCVSAFYCSIDNPSPLQLNISHNDPLCYGSYSGNAIINLSGGVQPYTYHWSNGSPYASLQNRNAGTYHVTVNDSQMCYDTSSVTLVNPSPITATSFIQNVTFYGLANGSADITPNGGTPPYTYIWSNGAHTQDIEQLSAGTYSVTIHDVNNCSANASFTVNQPSLLNAHITAQGSTTFCYGDSVLLDAGSGYLHYLWSTGAITQAIMVHESGYYSVQCTNSSSFGIDSIYIQVSHPYAYQGLCLVTVDSATNKNIIIWEKPANGGIVTYNLYKETTFAGQFVLMAALPFNALSMYVDTNSNPSVHSDRYKISVIDTCGNESELSNAHKTMHLTVSTGIGVYNLIWENYEGFAFGSYTIYRGASLSSLLPIGAIQSNLTTYTDYQPIGTYYYQIAVMKNDSCWASSNAKDMSGPFSQSLSNIEDNGIFVSVDNLSNRNNISVVPNPFKGATTIYFTNTNNTSYELIVTDITGKIVRHIKNATGNNFVLSRDGLISGYYMVEIKGENTYRKPVIVE